MRLAPNVDIIEAPFWGRPHNLVLFRGDRAALVDTGLQGQPDEVILPGMKALGVLPRDLSWIVNTHYHLDHIGGNSEIQRVSDGSAKLAAGQADRVSIEAPRRATRRQMSTYVDLDIMSAADLERHVDVAGDDVLVDLPLSGGEIIDLGGSLRLEIVAAPGHTAGHVAVFDGTSRILVQGEALPGDGLYGTGGEFLGAPVYEYVESSLETATVMAKLAFETFVPSHVAPMNRKQAARFFRESVDLIVRFDAEVVSRLQKARKPVSSVNLWKAMEGLWDRYPATISLYLMLETHLKRLIKRGMVDGTLAGGLEWVGGNHDDLEQLATEARHAIDAM